MEIELQSNLVLNFPRVIDPPDRSPGLHLSQVISSIASDSGMDNWGSHTGPPTLTMEMGFLWEEVLAMCLRDRLPTRIGEICLNGICMSPDGFDYDKWELYEYKCTWKSSNYNPADNWRWMTQIKSYLWAMKACVCHLYVLYINGDYRPPTPKYLQYRVSFTQQEKEENWNMIMNHAKHKGWIGKEVDSYDN